MALFVKGQIPYNKKVYLKKTCPVCTKTFEVRPSWGYVICCSKSCSQKGKPSNMKGKKASQKTREKQRIAKLGIRGENHWNYKGAARSKRKRAMSRDEYQTWRSKVFERDNFSCVECKVSGVHLHAHHIVAWSECEDLRYDVSNGITLCAACHAEKHPKLKKLILSTLGG